jgi:mutator protein MutT
VKHIACGVLVRNGSVLLGLRAQHKRIYPNLWDLPGGHVEPGETIEHALVREVEEEVGVVPTAFSKVATIDEPHPEINGRTAYHVFVVTAWTGEPTMRGDEHVELRWLSLDEACGCERLALDDYNAIFRSLQCRAP